jgi:hypothetical protein
MQRVMHACLFTVPSAQGASNAAVSLISARSPQYAASTQTQHSAHTCNTWAQSYGAERPLLMHVTELLLHALHDAWGDIMPQV